MNKEPHLYPQSTLFLRLLAGAYLIYTAYSLQDAIHEGPLFIVAMVGFGIIGAILIIQAGWKMYKGKYQGGPGDPAAAANNTAEDAENTAEEAEEK